MIRSLSQKNFTFKFILSLFICILTFISVFAADVQVNISPATPTVGSPAELVITAIDAARVSVVDGLPAVSGIRWYSDIPDYSSSMSIVNGRRTAVYSLRYAFTPTKSGVVTIPSLEISVDGVHTETGPIQISVQASASRSSASSSSGNNLQVSINPTNPIAGSQTELLITANNASNMTVRGTLPNVPGIEWSNVVSRSSSMSIVNGRRTTRYTLRCVFTPAKSGTFTIPEIDVNVDNTAMRTKPVQLTVSAPPTASEARLDPKTIAFTEITIPGSDRDTPKSYFIGEEIPLQITAFIRSPYRMQFEEYPVISAADDMTIRFHDYRKTNPEAPNFESVTQGHQLIGRGTFITYNFITKLRALSTGKLKLSVSVPAVILDTDSFFQSVVAQKKLSDALDNITILPLPAAPADAPYIGVMTSAKPEIELSPAPYRVGEPITLKIRLPGIENSETLTPPAFSPDMFRSYPPETVEQGRSAEIRYTLIPLEQGNYPLSLKFSTFNPETKQYSIADFHQSIAIEKAQGILKGASGPAIVNAQPMDSSSAISSARAKTAPETMLYLHDDIDSTVSIPLIKNTVVFIVIALLTGFGTLVFGILSFVRKNVISADESARRRRSAHAVRSGLLKKLTASSPRDLAGEPAAELCTYLNDMLSLSPGTPLNETAKSVERESPELAEKLRTLADAAWMPSLKDKLDQDFKMSLIKGIRKYFIFLVFLFLPFQTEAADELSAETKLPQNATEAKTAYDSGEFEQALQFYALQYKPATPSPSILYNMGNCLYQLGEYPRAMVCFERAKRLSPRDSDITGNLNLTRRKLMLPMKYQVESPGDFFLFIRDSFRTDEWLAGTAIGLMLIMISTAMLLRNRKGLWRWFMGAGGLVVLICAAMLTAQISAESPEKQAVVITRNAPLYSLPSEQSGRVEQYLKPGQEVHIEENRMDWIRVRLEDNSEGWLRSSSAALLWNALASDLLPQS